jgi:hypothetical protein
LKLAGSGDGVLSSPLKLAKCPVKLAGVFCRADVSLVLAAGRDLLIPQITSLPAEATVGQARDWIAL